MKAYQEKKKEIKESVPKTPKGKPKKTWSRTDFDSLTLALLNNPEFSVKEASTKDGKLVETEVFPVKEFREGLKTVLTDFGVDKQEAAKIETEYQFGKKVASSIYGLASSSITEYLTVDKKFKFIPEVDLECSLVMDNVAKVTKDYKVIGGEGTVKVTIDAHNKIKASSKAPKWKKKSK